MIAAPPMIPDFQPFNPNIIMFDLGDTLHCYIISRG